MKDNNESHIVVMVGTNNLKSDGTAMIMDKYKELVNQLKAKRFRKTSIVGILARNDLSNYNNSKRLAMNIQLKELCCRNEIDFLEIVIDKNAMLDSRGLHLNFTGQDKVARSIFKRSVRYLN
jgi:lysophospholipase L1-like esterase